MTPPDTYHHGDLKNALLDAVRRIIKEDGLDAVSLRGAARMAGVSHSAPAHHFADKRGMLTAFAAQGFELFRDRMRGAYESVADEGPEAQFGAIGIEYVRFAVEHPEHFSVMFRSELIDHDDPRYRDASEGAFGVLMGAVEASDPDRYGGADPTHVAIAAWSQVHGLATLWLDGALRQFTDEDIFSIMQAIFEADQRIRQDRS